QARQPELRRSRPMMAIGARVCIAAMLLAIGALWGASPCAAQEAAPPATQQAAPVVPDASGIVAGPTVAPPEQEIQDERSGIESLPVVGETFWYFGWLGPFCLIVWGAAVGILAAYPRSL